MAVNIVFGTVFLPEESLKPARGMLLASMELFQK